MSNKELAVCILNELTEQQLEAFITLFASENVRARIETERILRDPNRKGYGSLEEMKKDLLVE